MMVSIGVLSLFFHTLSTFLSSDYSKAGTVLGTGVELSSRFSSSATESQRGKSDYRYECIGRGEMEQREGHADIPVLSYMV